MPQRCCSRAFRVCFKQGLCDWQALQAAHCLLMCSRTCSYEVLLTVAMQALHRDQRRRQAKPSQAFLITRNRNTNRYNHVQTLAGCHAM
jgi:hypothetical protein